MISIYKLSLYVIFLVLITGCGSKKLTVKSLHPSLIPSEKLYNIAIEKFSDDYIYQTEQIERKLKNKSINGKRVFNLNSTLQNADALVTGDVNSQLNFSTYYKEYIDYNRCRSYRYEDHEHKDKKDKNYKKKKRKCIEYYVRLVPCENREYTVNTKIDVLKTPTNEILFSKEYIRSRSLSQCFDNYNYPYHSYPRNKREINRDLALQISNDFIDDISPHYVYYDVNIIEELNKDTLKFTDQQNDRFEKIVELVEKRNLDLAKEELLKLDVEFNSKSYEVLYNIGLIHEAKANLYGANLFYKKAKTLVRDIDTLKLISNSISRTNRNLEEKIKAKSQLQ
jgi:hypothetical protein